MIFLLPEARGDGAGGSVLPAGIARARSRNADMALGLPRLDPEKRGDLDELDARLEASADDSQELQAWDDFFGVALPAGARAPAPSTGYSGYELVPVLTAGRVISGTGYAPVAAGNGSSAPADGSSASEPFTG